MAGIMRCVMHMTEFPEDEGCPDCRQARIEGRKDARPSLGAGIDPWAHRSAGMRCRTCMWYATKQLAGFIEYDANKPGDRERAVKEGRGEIGRCRRHAPTMNGYPVVFEHDWCGDHKLDENRA